jgi:hypothetical protein
MSRLGCRILLYWNRFRWHLDKDGNLTNYNNRIQLQKNYVDVGFNISCKYKNNVIKIHVNKEVFTLINGNSSLGPIYIKLNSYVMPFHFKSVPLTSYIGLYKHMLIAIGYIDDVNLITN